jgi:hypothetical protein
MGAGASSGVISNSIAEANKINNNNVNQQGSDGGMNKNKNNNKPTPIDTSNLSGSPKKRSASIVGKNTFRALLSLDEKELVVGRSPGSRLRKLAGTDELETSADNIQFAKIGGNNNSKTEKKNKKLKMKKNKKGPVKMQRKMNTTSTLLSLNTTMENAPTDITIRCMSYVIRTHIATAVEAKLDKIDMARAWKVFDDRADLLPSPTKRADGISIFHDSIRDSPIANTSSEIVYDRSLSPTSNVLPRPALINKFITHIFKTAQMEIDSLIIALVYLERLLEVGAPTNLYISKNNWKTLVFTCLMLGSKIWDDLAMENKDLATLWPPITLKRVNQLERRALEALKYNVKVPASLYAQYYFRLRSLVTYLDLPEDEVSDAFEAMQPLSAIEARKMEVLSSRYEQRVAIVTPKPKKKTRISRSMSFDSGKQAKDFGGNATGKKTANIPASIDEFMSNSTAETPAFGAAIWKKKNQSNDMM